MAPDTVAGQVVVELDPTSTAAQRRAAIAAVDGTVVEDDSSAGTMLIAVADGDLAAAIETLTSQPGVAAAAPNAILRAFGVPTDPLIVDQRDLDLIRAKQAWRKSTGSAAVRVAVLDTGIDLDHPDRPTHLVGTFSTVDGSTAADDNGHGTAVAGVIAAAANTIGTAGIAPGVEIVSIKVLGADGTGTYYDLTEGFTIALAQGADIVLMALGGAVEEYPSQDLALAIHDAVNAGTVVIAAAGDSGSTQAPFPARLPGVVAVAATDDTGEVMWSSNHGPWLTIAAPGRDVLSTAKAPGTAGAWARVSGSSMAAAEVAGVAALIASETPRLPNGRIVFELLRTASDRGAPGYDDQYGVGLVDAAAAVGAAGAQLPVPLQAPVTGDPDGGPVDAPLVAASDTASGSIELAGDEDWYAITVPASQRVAVTITPPAFTGTRTREMDPAVELYDSAYRLLAGSTTRFRADATTVAANVVAGKVYVRVRNAFASASPAPYQLTVARSAWVSEGFNAAATNYPTQHYVRDAALADINRDGLQDAVLVTLDWINNGTTEVGFVEVALGSAQGFAPASVVAQLDAPMSGQQMYITAGDLDGDGDPDAMVSSWGYVFNTPDEVHKTWLLRSAAGALGPLQLLNSEIPVNSLEFMPAGVNPASVIIGSWTGGYSLDASGVVTTLPSIGPFSLRAVGDFDGDGRPDASVVPDGGVAGYIEEQDNGTWAVHLPYDSSSDPGYVPGSGIVGLGDFDGNGLEDVLLDKLGNGGVASLRVSAQGPAGTFQPSVPLRLGLYPEVNATADVNGDGIDDLVVQHSGDVTGVLSLGTMLGRAGFGLDDQEKVGALSPGLLRGMHPVDVEGDGQDELDVSYNTLSYKSFSFLDQRPVAATAPGAGAWVVDSTPASRATSAAVGADITVTLGRAVTSSTVNQDNVFLLGGRANEWVPATVTYSASTKKVTVNPTAPLRPNTTYSVVLLDITDAAGAAIPDTLIGFRTGAGAQPTVTINGTYTPIVGDFDAFGPSDVYLYSGTGGDSLLWGSAFGPFAVPGFAGLPASMRSGAGDFNGDGYDDMLLYFTSSGWVDSVALRGPSGWTISSMPQIYSLFTPLVGDFNGDGYDDLVLYAPGTAADHLWYGGATALTNPVRGSVSVSGTYTPIVGDLTGDGFDDILWYGLGTAADYLYRGGPTGFTSTPYTATGTFQPFTGDFDGNGFDDVFWYSPTAADRITYNSATGPYDGTVTVTSAYRPAAGDLDGDGFTDILWYAPGSTAEVLWWGTPTGPRRL